MNVDRGALRHAWKIGWGSGNQAREWRWEMGRKRGAEDCPAGEQREVFRDFGQSSFREAVGAKVSRVQERAGGQKWERVSMDSIWGEICYRERNQGVSREEEGSRAGVGRDSSLSADGNGPVEEGGSGGGGRGHWR